MHDFAVVSLLALAIVKLVDFVGDGLGLRTLRSPLTFVAGVGAALALDYSLFAGWDISVRNDDIGWLMTGFVVAGLTVAWRAVFAYLTHERATRDETLGERSPLRAA